MAAEEIKAWIRAEIETRREELQELSQRIYSCPEIGFQEANACSWLTEYLRTQGFGVEGECCGLATAFRGQYGSGTPAVAFLAEYDALPGLGHGCGHNLIAVAAVGAGVGAKIAVDHLGGRVLVVGTPAEEQGGGKVLLVERGAFQDVDVALMFHPGSRDAALTGSLACQSLEVEFFGKAAHAAALPEEGINALEALLLSFQGINSLRQHLRPDARVHGIITQGGDAANVVPAYTAGHFLVRASEPRYLEELKQKVLNCFQAAAQASGARLEWRWGKVPYAPLRPNQLLGETFATNMQSLGRNIEMGNPRRAYGSTDMGNVSQVVPAIHPSLAIAPRNTPPHSEAFRQASGSPEAYQVMLLAATAMAMTATDVISQPSLLAQIKQEFAQGESGG